MVNTHEILFVILAALLPTIPCGIAILYLWYQVGKLNTYIKTCNIDWLGFIAKQTGSISKSVDDIYNLLSRESGVMIWSASSNGTIEWISEEFRRFSGVTLEYMKLNPHNWWNILIHPDDLKRVDDAWNYSAIHNNTYDITFRFRRQDGEYFNAHSKAIIITDGFQIRIKWVGIISLLDQ